MQRLFTNRYIIINKSTEKRSRTYPHYPPCVNSTMAKMERMNNVIYDNIHYYIINIVDTKDR